MAARMPKTPHPIRHVAPSFEESPNQLKPTLHEFAKVMLWPVAIHLEAARPNYCVASDDE
jgi:hypothetical protein